ncbi:MAG: hypothetical protein ACFFDF_14855 [Candidatus Odinarchaeota archaeon]
MSQKSEEILKARRELIRQTLDKICEPCNFWEFKSKTFVVLCHLWLHIKAEKEGLFELEEWAHSELKNQLIKKIETFLTKNIR